MSDIDQQPSEVDIATRARFDRVRYASLWEDADVLCDALAPVASGRRLLSIASAGDNALALLTLDPAEVVAVDLSGAQLVCVELRMAAFRHLDEPGLLGFLGVAPRNDRLATYRQLRADLSQEARAFWDGSPQAIADGVIHAGKFERYLRGFRRFVLPFVHSRHTCDELLRARDPEQRREFYDRVWDTARWRLLFRLFFGRVVMGRLGRDPSFFDHVEGDVGRRILARTKWALTALPTESNPYLCYIMTGTFSASARPRYLRSESIDLIRQRLDRMTLYRGAIDRPPGCGRFAGFNLSDVFEYMSPEEHTRVYTSLLERAEPGARLVYWNMLAPRSRPVALQNRVRPLVAEARALHGRDRAWFYSALHIDQVESEPVSEL